MSNFTPDPAEYPFKSKYLNMNGHRFHYVDEGSGHPIIFVHGTPSWSFDFRHVIRKLRATYRCIAYDHMGFGLSDKPADYDYSTPQHSRTFGQFIEKTGIGDPFTLIVHDFGGPIALHWAVRNPHRLARIIVLNSWMWSSEGDPDFKKLKRVLKSPLIPFLYLRFNFSARYIMPSSFGRIRLSPKIKRHYTAPFPDRKSRLGTLAFAHSLLNDQPWFEAIWERRKALQNLPAAVIWGMRDPVVKPHLIEKWKEVLPLASIVTLPNAGHFPQEEEGEMVAQNIEEQLRVNF